MASQPPKPLFLFAFPILTTLFTTVSCLRIYQCSPNGNYTENSPYYTNLLTILSSLPSNIDNNGFNSASQGSTAADRVHAVALCRGDLQLVACRACVKTVAEDLVTSCRNRRQAVLWDNVCMVRYSDEPILRIRADAPGHVEKNMAANATNPDQFNDDLGWLLGTLISSAASGGELMKVAAGERGTALNATIFALLQCTPDLLAADCKTCLAALAARARACCNTTIGARILAPSCMLNYETFAFYNTSRIQEVKQTFPVPQDGPTVGSSPPPTMAAVPVPSPRGKQKDSKARTIIFIVVPIIFCLLLLACCIVMSKRRKGTEKKCAKLTENETRTAESLQYEFKKIKDATNNFSDANKVGEGGFGAVYKGKLEDDQEIAVKRLFMGTGQRDSEFQNEIMLLAKLQHRNLVRLHGFARDQTERVLVYEFVNNGSLDHYIFDQPTAHFVDWDTRFKIIRGIAKGLLYLHEDSRLRIIHRDLKASNILLDTTMNPKIADFGLARLCNETEANTKRIVGTYGYMPPEYVHHGRFSIKTDVYGFGVLALEIICGQKNSNFRNEGITIEEGLLNYAWRNWNERTIVNVIDPTLQSESSNLGDIIRCVHIALLCVQERTHDRPTMASVSLMLSNFNATLPPPTKPAFFVSRSSDQERPEDRLVEHTPFSNNEASITELYPR
ncbi:cysteine-rich receptor-like protein kinase 44 isoform X2 [Andrographis paniculata]|uniref:cysteine-rich receptor-like protein kinase 44 isoform X2 n=1 Tax=Andrographis paniculata TaxID=175694 RepID=UPI0021E8D8EA|nr:cysteine-rich receptor-like protein kinase 44 isoform X2 [Andrographis paniculata]